MAKALFKIFIFIVWFSTLNSSVVKMKKLETRVTLGTKVDPNIAKTFVSMMVEFNFYTKTCGGFVFEPNAIFTASSCVLE